MSRLSPGERDPPQPGTHETTVDSEAGHRMVPRVPAENGRAQKTVKHPRPTEERVAQEGAVHEHSTNLDPSLSSSPVVAVPQKQPHGADVVPVGDRRPVSGGGSGSTCLGDCSGLPQQSLLVRESEGLSHSKEGGALSTPDMPAKASLDSKRHIPEGSQATTLHGKQGKVNVPLGSKLTDMIVGHENVSKEGGLMDESRRESTLSAEPTSKQTIRTAAESGRKDGLAVVPDVSMSTAKDAQTGELKHSRGPSEVEHLTVVARRKENSEVDTSAGGSTASSLSHQRNREAEDGAKPSLATSTEGKDKGMTSNPVNTRAATTTSSEAGEGEVALPGTSIEADNGLTRGSITNALHTRAHASPATVFAAAEEGGAVVTEGFSESETFLTSTKEGDSGECALAGSGEPAVDPAAAQAATVNDSVNSAMTEEKDDAVTSAGSEGKCEGSSSQDSERVGGNVTFTGEGESDGAVTSAGTELRERSLSSGERAVMRVGPKKEPEGTVTCTGAERGSEGMATCTVTGAGPQEERLVTGAAEVLADNDTPPGASAPQEGGGSVNDGAEGESAVTSTGITEDAEGPASCTGSEEGSEGFALSCESEENGQSATGSTAAKEATNVPLVAAGPGDDEDIVTSTGAKEEDEEGEGVVTSTGRGNELGHASACAGTEESEGVPVCESVEEGDAQIGTAVGHAAAEAGATVSAHESNVDSMSAADKEMKDTEICSSAKGIVESSVTSVASAKAGAALGPEGCEGPMTSAASGHSDSPLARKDHVEETAISTGLVGGSYERLVSAAGPQREVHHMSPREKEDEGAITSVESEERDGRLAAAAASDITNQSGGMGLVISTSTMSDCTAQLSARMDGEGHPSSLRAEEGAEGTGVSTEEFEAPMPSAASGEESPLAVVGEEEKDECAMISTSLGEECEVPVSSASTILGAGSQQPVTVVGGRAPGPVLVSTDDFEVPMPSAPTKAESPLASTSKEEKDECALISTSVAEGCEACIARVAAESGGEQPGPAVEEKDGSAVISTSSVEDCEGPVSSAVPREQVRPSATPAEEVSDTTVISTSTSEGREAVMRSAGLQDEDRPATAGAEDVSEAALISTSTAECALGLASLDGHGETSLTAGHPEGTRGQSSVKVSQCEAPMPSLIAENNCQCPGPLPGGKAVSPEERRDGVPVSALSAGGGQLGEKRIPLSPEAEMAGDSSPASPSAGRDVERSAGEPASLRAEQTPGQTAEGSSISAHSVTAEKAGAEMAEDRPQGRDTAVEQPSLPPAQQDPTTTARIHGQGPDATPAHSVLPDVCSAALPAAACEQDLPIKSVQTPAEKTGDGAVKPSQKGGALAVTVSPEENLGDKGSEESPSDVLGGLDLKASVRTEIFVPAVEETTHEIPAPSESPRGRKPPAIAEQQRESGSVNTSLKVENSGSRTNEDVHSKSHNKEEISSARDDSTEAGRGQGAEADPAEVEENERHTRGRKRKKHYPSSEDELDDNSDAPDSKIEAARRRRSEAEPRDAKEESSGDSEESSKTSLSTRTAAARAMEERDEYSSGEAAGEKTEQNDDDNSKSQEEDQPVIIKRKRGRPRKHPVETALKTKEDCKADTSIVTVEQSPPGGKPKVVQADESSKETGALQERSGSNDDGDERTVAGARRRGRKPKRSLTSSDDAESSEPERKRQKSVSEATEDRKDQESEEEEEEEEEDEPSGATTRSATRSKAQLSPSTKRKREASPPGARTRGQQRVEEAPTKKVKR